MNYINSFKTAWKKGFDFKGISTRQEFLEYHLTDLVIRVFLIPVFIFLITQFLYLSYERELTIIPELINVLLQLLKIFKVLYIGGTLFVATSLTIRSLRNVGAKWQWIFLHFIPLGFILIYFFPLKKEKK